MKLIITALLQQKINYLLSRFDIEWSGPAWFSFETSDNGFPKVWKLEHFLPLDLGSHSETEWSGKHFMNISKKLYQKHPELKQMYQGNIHSHHTMGAFFSGTDKQLLKDGANDVGYPSLVVAASGKETHAFAISYLEILIHGLTAPSGSIASLAFFKSNSNAMDNAASALLAAAGVWGWKVICGCKPCKGGNTGACCNE